MSEPDEVAPDGSEETSETTQEEPEGTVRPGITTDSPTSSPYFPFGFAPIGGLSGRRLGRRR